MSGSVNHRGWIVLDSIRSIDGHWCVDVFERPAGGFGFEHFRADPEDAGRWTAIGGLAGRAFDSAVAALDAAVAEIAWLGPDRADVVAARERLAS